MGTVMSFDEHRGYGTVRATDGRELFFHCTAIADGTRRIPVGARVVFAVVPGHGGQWEAADVESLPGAGEKAVPP
jgi:cold shock CspA family protein